MRNQIEVMAASFGWVESASCRDCVHCVMKNGWKCELYGADDRKEWRISWPACGMHNKAVPDGFVPLRERGKKKSKPEEGRQINLEV